MLIFSIGPEEIEGITTGKQTEFQRIIDLEDLNRWSQTTETTLSPIPRLPKGKWSDCRGILPAYVRRTLQQRDRNLRHWWKESSHNVDTSLDNRPPSTCPPPSLRLFTEKSSTGEPIVFLQSIEDLHEVSYWFDGEIPLTGILIEMKLFLHLIGQGSIALQEFRRVVQPEKMSNILRIRERESLVDRFRLHAKTTNTRRDSCRSLSLHLPFKDTKSISIGQLDVTR